MKKAPVIKLYRGHKCWIAEHLDDNFRPHAKTVEVFGTYSLPTSYHPAAAGEYVQTQIQKQNPCARVHVGASNPHNSRRHKTRWTVTNLKTGYCKLFQDKESAKSYALSFGDITPLALRAPLYEDD